MTAQSKPTTLPDLSVNQLRAVRDSLNAILAEAQPADAQATDTQPADAQPADAQATDAQAVDAQATDTDAQATDVTPGKFRCKPVESVDVEALNIEWRELKTDLRLNIRGGRLWSVSPKAKEVRAVAMYLHTILVGWTLMLPSIPTVLPARTRRIFTQLKRAVGHMCNPDGTPDDHGVNTLRYLWKYKRRSPAGCGNNNDFVKPGPWEDVAESRS